MSKRVSKFATPGEPTTSRGLEAVVEAKNGKLPERYFSVENCHFRAKNVISAVKMRSWCGFRGKITILRSVADSEQFQSSKNYCLQNLHMTSPELTQLRQLRGQKYR